jgi:hypothetical protein
MHAVLMVVVATRLMVAGGAGMDAEAAAHRPPAGRTWREAGKTFSTLRKEVSTLRQDYARSREAQESQK